MANKQVMALVAATQGVTWMVTSVAGNGRKRPKLRKFAAERLNHYRSYTLGRSALRHHLRERRQEISAAA